MDDSHVAAVVGSNLSVSDKIRALAAAGHARADIARLLGKRYQHVRNVLEADRVAAQPAPAVRDATPGVEEPSRLFAAGHRLAVEPGGMVRLPPDLLTALQAKPGSVVIAEVQDDGVHLFSNAAAWDRVRAMVRQIGIDPKRDLVAELLAERRAEVARDD